MDRIIHLIRMPLLEKYGWCYLAVREPPNYLLFVVQEPSNYLLLGGPAEFHYD